MAQSIFWKVNNVTMPCPSTWSWGLQDISAAESGRTDSGLMYKNRIGQKRKIQVGFNGVKPDVMQTVLNAINPEYISVYYYDPMIGSFTTKTFYVGDRTGNVKWWWDGCKVYESLTFDLIER